MGEKGISGEWGDIISSIILCLFYFIFFLRLFMISMLFLFHFKSKPSRIREHSLYSWVFKDFCTLKSRGCFAFI